MDNGKVFTIGSATMDVFVECDSANIVSVCKQEGSTSFMSYPYGSKVDMSSFATNVGGGGVNTAMNFSNLGFDTTPIVKIGKDIYSEGILAQFKNGNLNMDCVVSDPKISTGFSIILVSFQGDRTVLAHRGANGLMTLDDIDFDKLKQAKWLYIAPLNGESNKILEPLVNFAKENDIIVCFNAGTTSIKQGFEYIKNILKTVNIVVMNKEEASMCTGITVRPDTKTIKYSNEIIHPDIKEMLVKLKVKDYQMIVITDGGDGSYSYNGDAFYYCPVFSSDVVSTLGAGDAYASTLCAALKTTNLDIETSMKWASVESASVVSKFGATEGLIKFDEIEQILADHPEYRCIKVDA